MSGERLTNIESLPDDLLSAILVHLPAQDILNGAMLVCRKWYRFINSPNFINAHLQNSPPGLLVQYFYEKGHPIFMAMQQGKTSISKFNYKFNSSIMGSCNGLVVETNSMGGVYVVNPTTGQCYALPRNVLQGITYTCAVMAYAAASKEYKVVVKYSYSCDRVTSVKFCAILTVGVDRYWRLIDTEHLPITATEFFNSSPLVAGVFIYWTERKGTRVLTLNVDAEVFTSTPVPKGYDKRLKYYLSTGTCLTMVVTCNNLSWEVWELKQEASGEWIMMFEIEVADLEKLVAECSGNKPSILHNPYGWLSPTILEPVGWLNHGEVLLLRASNQPRICFLYNVRIQQMDSYELIHDFGFYEFQTHRNSLVQLVF